MSSMPDDDGELWECDACNGTGIEEGREWDGEKCRECKGRGFKHLDDGDGSTVGARDAKD